MRRTAGGFALIVLLTLCLIGSGVQAQAPRTRLRLAFNSVADLADVPVLLVGERLKVQRIDLEPIFFANDTLATQAVLRGDAQIAAGPSRGVFVAIQQGAGIVPFLTQNRNGWTLYTRKEITQCQELNGKRLAVHSQGALSTALVRNWLKERCPSATPNILIISGSENRAAALMANQIDATPLELSDALQVDHLRPGHYHRLVDFGKELPWLLDAVFFVSARTLPSNRQVLKEFVRELIKIHRLARRDPSVIAAVAPKYIEFADPTLLLPITRAFAESGLWPADGGFTPQTVAQTIRFLTDIEAIKPGLRAERIGDYTLVREVLEELDR